jgi:hypothetical protein
MARVLLGCLAGLLLGVMCVAWLLPVCVWVVRLMGAPSLQVEHWVYYIGVILGAAAGAVCGALAGSTSAVVRALRERPSERR